MDKPPSNDPPGKSPFEKFRELAQRVVSVPKAEIDKREAEYQRQRATTAEQKGSKQPH